MATINKHKPPVEDSKGLFEFLDRKSVSYTDDELVVILAKKYRIGRGIAQMYLTAWKRQKGKMFT